MERSAQCASSTTRTTGSAAPARSISVRTCSNRRIWPVPSSGGSAAAVSAGIRRTRSGRAAAGISEVIASRPRCRRIALNGAYGRLAAPRSRHPPVSVRRSRVNSVTRRVFPPPGLAADEHGGGLAGARPRVRRA
ncbi:hypothetical protein LUX73_52055 [Actinomadura madurae]|nr:hypothetical protein [Actinomadura madurae]MCQ0012328.1 hypothetical protein [Actinomadura madurae]